MNGVFSRAAASAESLSKSVLGTLALFLLLVYFIGSVTLVTAKLTEWNQTVLVVFIVLFPVVVLGVFYILVTKHFAKILHPDKVDKKIYAQIVLETVRGSIRTDLIEQLPSAESSRARDAVVKEIGHSKSETEKEILSEILNWYSPEWRQKRYFFRHAADKFGDKPDVVFADERNIADIIDVFRFIDHVGKTLNTDLISPDKVPLDFKKSAVRYADRGRLWLKYLRKIKKDESRYADFTQVTNKWRTELSSSKMPRKTTQLPQKTT